MAIFTDGWVRMEGPNVKDPYDKYGTLDKIPAEIANRIFYSPPEIQIENPNNTTGSVYRILYLEDYFSHGSNTINDINSYWDVIQSEINAFSKQIEWTQTYTSFYIHDPFVLTKSAVIFYADSTNDGYHLNYDKTCMILIDEAVKPKTVSITATYTGPSIPVGEKYNKEDVKVYAKFEDGNEVEVDKELWKSDPDDLIVPIEGVNQFRILYTGPEGEENESMITVQGIKNLNGIIAEYDTYGPRVAEGHAVDTRYIIVYAQYTDGTIATVSNFTFPDGKVVSQTNGGVLTVEYKSYTTTVTVPMFTINTGRLIAFYNGPDVEVGHEYQKHYVTIKVYYESDNAFADSYYEDVPYDDPGLEYSTDIVEYEGTNQIQLKYQSKVGELVTYFTINGFYPEKRALSMEAAYVGPEIEVGKSYSTERVIAKIHFSDGTVTEIKNFGVSGNVITEIGPNEFTASYTYTGTSHSDHLECTFAVIGIAPEDTTKSGYVPIQLANNYPESQRTNNRYRGPAEAMKHEALSMELIHNLVKTYRIFADIEKDFYSVSNQINSDMSVKVQTICTVQDMDDMIDSYITDEQYSIGTF